MTPVTLSANPVVADSVAAPSADSAFSFGDLLDIVNPLQHIPIVSTIYRAITGDQIQTLPKIAGDTLFGGVAGFVSSVADTIFEKITGKNLGDTVLAWVEGEFSTSATIASGAPAANASGASIAPQMEPAAVAPASPNSIVIPGQDALLMALTRKSVDQDLALRAATAYRSTIDISAQAGATALH